MAAKPLSLKREKSRRATKAGAFTKIVEVLLDHEVAHLDQSFTYGVPEKFFDSVQVGSIVKVPFNKTELQGVVVQSNESGNKSVKPILKVVHQVAYSESAIAFAREVSKRYATSPIKFLNLMPLLKEGQKSPEFQSKTRVLRRFIPETARSLADLAERLMKTSGTRLIFAPTLKEASHLLAALERRLGEQVISFEAWKKLKGSERDNRVIVGMRGMIFIQVAELSEMVIFDESSEHFWDQRSPFWNLRDVALLRSRLEEIPFSFISGSPSLELVRLAETQYLRLEKSAKSYFRRRRFTMTPQTFHGTVRKGLESGSVLVSVANKSYSNSLVCKKCNAIPRCKCGFPLKLIQKDQALCSVCGELSSHFRCSECFGLEFIQIGKGIERYKEEFAKAFPNVPIVICTADQDLAIPSSNSIVLSTPGVEPRFLKYSALVLLDGVSRVSRATLRAEEQLRNHWHRLLALTTDDAPVFLTLPNSHPITQSLIANDPYRQSKQALNERKEAKLPPGFRVIRIKGELLSALAEKLKNEFEDIELSRVSKNDELVIRVEISKAQTFISALHALQKYRGASGKDLLSLEIDPFDI